MKQKTKAILVDILGFTCIIASPLLGWLPGPGGIPLLILGLSLLANNHEWAEKILEHVKREFNHATKRVTEADPFTKWVIDIMSVLFIAAAVILLTYFTRSIATAAGVSLVVVGVTLLVTNQERHLRAWRRFRRKHKH